MHKDYHHVHGSALGHCPEFAALNRGYGLENLREEGLEAIYKIIKWWAVFVIRYSELML